VRRRQSTPRRSLTLVAAGEALAEPEENERQEQTDRREEGEHRA